jgi:ABC-type sugar transport system substrate-binding protein
MMGRRTSIGLAVVAALAITSACGSSGSSTTGNSGGGGGATGGDSGVAAAQTAVDGFLKVPANIGLTATLTKKPEAGKKMIITETPEPVTIKVNDAMVAAATALGWTTSRIEIGTGAEDPAKALDSALDQKPDLIIQTGAPASQLRAQLARAKSEKIVVLRSDNTDPPGIDGTVVNTGIDSGTQTGAYGTMMADYVVAQTKGKANVVLVNFPVYPILNAFAAGFDKELKAKCSSCKSTRLNQQVSDLVAGKTPSAVVSALQRDSSVNWVVLSLGDATLGLKAALRSAGLTDKVKIGGESAGTGNITALKKGDEEVWTGFTAAILGWRRVDAAARYFNGESLDPAHALMPTQLITKDNVATAPLDPQGYYLGVPDYEKEFKALWKVG